MTLSDKIDSVVTNRVLALPIFFIIMTLVYYISVTTVGGWATDWTNDVFFGEIVNDAATSFLASVQAPDWLSGLIVDGIIGSGICAADPPYFLLYVPSGRLRIYGSCCLYHGQDFPPFRTFRKVLHSDSGRDGMRCSCGYGYPYD